MQGQRITKALIEEQIKSIHFVSAAEAHKCEEPALKLVTLGTVVLKSGWTISDSSACVYPDQYNWDRGVSACTDKLMKRIGDHLAALIVTANGPVTAEQCSHI